MAFIDSLTKPFLRENFSKNKNNSQKQAIIRFIKKKCKDKRFIQNWKPLSLINIDVKTLLKELWASKEHPPFSNFFKLIFLC